jgi:hypothetical protein
MVLPWGFIPVGEPINEARAEASLGNPARRIPRPGSARFTAPWRVHESP